MKKHHFFAGLLAGIILLAAGGTIVASTGAVTISVNYSDIKITVDGTQINPTDGNGNTVEPFIYNGTTYLPVRAVAEAVGKNVAWDGSTKTVALTTPGNTGSAPAPAAPVQTSAPAANNGNVGKVLVDKEGIKITFLGLEKTGTYSKSYKFKFQAVNNSGKNITIQTRNESINGVMISGMCSCDVQNGKIALDDIEFFCSSLEEKGITTISNYEFNFTIFEEESWDDIFDSDTISLDF